MKLDMLIDELQEIVDTSSKVPFLGGRKAVNIERLQEIVDEMRTNMPQEVRQAKNIAADRSNILAKSKQEAETIVQQAEERAKGMVERSEITRQAQMRAAEIIQKANEEANAIKKAASDYVDDIMRKAESSLSSNLASLKKTRQSFKALQAKKGTPPPRAARKPAED